MKKLLILFALLGFISPAIAGPYFSGGGGGGSGDATTIHGLAVEDPDAADDGKFIQYEHTGTLWQLAAPGGGGDMLIAVWDGDTDGFIDADAGGTDIDTSAATGVPSIAAGTWSVAATLTHELGGLEADVSAYAGLVKITGGSTSAVAVTANGESLITAANYAAMRTLLDLEAGTDFYSVAAADAAFEAELDNSAGLLAALDDETGTGVAVFNINPTLTGVTVTGDITATGAAMDFDLIDDTASALSFDATGKAGIIDIVTTDDGEGVTMSGTLTVAGALTSTGVLTATAAGANITMADAQLLDMSGITHTGATDEGIALPNWADVSPTSDKHWVAVDSATGTLKWYNGGWLSSASVAAPVDAKYIVQQTDATLTAEQSLGALASGILYSTTTTGVLSIATEAQLEATSGALFGASKVVTSGYIWVADGTDFESVAMSGDVTIASGGATTIGADTVALTTDTTGNYTATIADAGNSTITVVNGATEGGAVTLDAVDLNCTDCINATEIEDIYLLTAGDSIADDTTITFGTADLTAGVSWDTNLSDVTDFTFVSGEGLKIVGTNQTGEINVVFENAGTDEDYGVSLYVKNIHTEQIHLEGTGDSWIELDNNAALDTTGYKIAFINGALNAVEADVEKELINTYDGFTMLSSATTVNFNDVTNLTIPATADAAGEIGVDDSTDIVSFGVQDGAGAFISYDFTGIDGNDTYVMAWDEASNKFIASAQAGGGGDTSWDDLNHPDPGAAASFAMDGAGETTTFTMSADNTEWLFNFTAPFTTALSPDLFKIFQTGNAETSTLVTIQASDSDVTVLEVGDGTNIWTVSTAGLLTNAGTATLNLAAATDLTIGGDQIDYNDMAGIASVIAGGILPSTANDDDLGSTGLEWDNLYLGNGGTILFGDDQDVYLAHIVGVGLEMALDDSIMFGDSAVFIESDDDGYLDLDADTGIRLNGAVTASSTITATTNIIIGDAGYVGSASDTDALQIEADGDIVLTQDLAITGTLTTTGGVLSLTPVTDTAANFAANFTGANLYGGTFVCNGAGTLQLPAVAVGMNFTIITLGAIAVSADTNASDLMILDGTALNDGDKATNLSTAGDIIVFQYYDATGWLATSNGWTDGGA